MSSDTGYLALLLDAPLQSWGFASRFQRRTTGLHPTKSGVLGMICAAMGIGKGTDAERKMLPKLAALNMTSIAIPRVVSGPRAGMAEPVPMRRLEDFHTVGAAYDENDPWERQMMIHNAKRKLRKNRGGYNPDTTIRQYLLDARFGIILTGDRILLERVAAALQNPLWGIWFGRKSCIPAEPICRGVFATRSEAERALVGNTPIEQFTRVEEVAEFDKGTDSYNDQPVSFGRADSSSEGRLFSVRRVKIIPASIQNQQSQTENP